MIDIHVRRLAVTRGMFGEINTGPLLQRALRDAMLEGHTIISVVQGFQSEMRGEVTIEFLVVSSTQRAHIENCDCDVCDMNRRRKWREDKDA